MKRHLEYPDCSLYELILRTAREHEELCALEYYGRRFSFRRLIGEISRCARALRAAGVREGDSVSICLPNIPQAVFLFYAVNKIGAVANMIHPLSGEEEIVRFVTLTESRFLFAVDLIADKLERVRDRLGGAEIVLASPGDCLPPFKKGAFMLKGLRDRPNKYGFLDWNGFIENASSVKDNFTAPCDPDRTAAILYSGGTTGKPKGIMLTDRNFNALALQSIDGCGCLEVGDRMLSVMPIFHGFGLGVCIHTIISEGGTAVILPKFSVKDFHKLLFRYRPNIIAGVPAIYEAMLVSPAFEGRDLGFIKCVISGGDSLSPETKKKLNRMLRDHGCAASVREGYGLTECVTGSCLEPENCVKTSTVGLPYADTFYKIIDPKTDLELSAGETGEIILRGPSVMKGYYKEPGETAQTLRRREDGHIWLHTGDLGYMDREGYVFFRQRLKRMIVSNGYNIYPQILENIISSHEAVVLCAVVGVPDRQRGQIVKAFVQLREGADQAEVLADLVSRLRKNAAAYAQPREIVFMKELPKTLVGKIAYNELR